GDDLVGTALADLADPADRAAVADLVGGSPRPDPLVAAFDRDGDRRLVELRAAVDEAGDVVVSLRDRTEERLALAVIDTVADTTLVLDEQGLVRWQSRAVAGQIPGGPEQGIGINPLERI